MKLFNCILGIIVVCSIFSCSKYYRKMVCDEGHYYGETLNGVRSGMVYYIITMDYDMRVIGKMG